MGNPFKSPIVLSFCPGLLGIERGLERAGCKVSVAAYVEIESFIIANLVAGMESGVLDPAPIWTDAKTFDARPFRGRVHGIIGGYPCPGESLAGLREGHLYKGFIWPAIRRAIDAARPLFCFFENVDDHLTGTYPIVRRSLSNLGYAVEEGVFSAEEVGAPHERQRLFILAVENSFRTRIGDQSGKTHRQGWRQNVRQDHGATCSIRSESAGAELAHTYDQQCGGAERGKPKNGPKKRNKKVAYPGSSGSQRMQSGLVPGQRSGISRPVTQCRPQDFPLGQGHEQWDWEEPRTIESSMEYSIDGYNFTGDLLRAIGNSVVEQTAELAFRTLIGKHGLDHLL